MRAAADDRPGSRPRPFDQHLDGQKGRVLHPDSDLLDRRHQEVVGAVAALVILVPQFLPVQQDPWWYQSALIPVLQGFEGTARELAGDVADWFRQLTG